MFLSGHLEPHSANEASKVLLLEQGMVLYKIAVGKPRTMGFMYRIFKH